MINGYKDQGLSQINKIQTNYSIPVNNLKTQSPSNAPAQNGDISSKLLNSIGGGIKGFGKILGNTDMPSSFANIANAANAGSSTQKTMGMADAGVDALASAASAFGPVGAAIGAGLKIVNSVGGKFVKDTGAIKDFGVNENISSGYGGVNTEAQNVSSDIGAYKDSGLAGKLFGRSKISRAAAINTGKQYAASQISNQQNKIKDAASNSTDMLAANTNRKLQRTNPGESILLKKGGLIPKLKKGGSIIVSGSLHARKHDLDNTKGLLKDITITDKGVPVVLINKNGGEMVAEFEKEEIVFRKEIIDEISELRDEYEKEESEEEKKEILFEIGKILTKEILSKTKDKDNLIDGID